MGANLMRDKIIYVCWVVLVVGFIWYSGYMCGEQNLFGLILEGDSFFQILPDNESPLSPFDHIKQSQISVYQDNIIINISNTSWGGMVDSNSMYPLIDFGHNSIEITPKSESEVHVGDIIIYNNTNENIIHRVIGLGEDEEGWYCTAKGDNNKHTDPWKIRFEDILGIVVIIVY